MRNTLHLHISWWQRPQKSLQRSKAKHKTLKKSTQVWSQAKRGSGSGEQSIAQGIQELVIFSPSRWFPQEQGGFLCQCQGSPLKGLRLADRTSHPLEDSQEPNIPSPSGPSLPFRGRADRRGSLDPAARGAPI